MNDVNYKGLFILLGLATAPFIISVTGFYLYNRFMEWLQKWTDEARKAYQDKQDMEWQAIYDDEIKPAYLAVKNKFNALVKSGNITKAQLKILIKVIDECLGSYADKYKNYRYSYKGAEANEIYVKLKSVHLDKSDFERISNYLDIIEATNLKVISLQRYKHA